jgi:hypothetical protein
VIGGFGAYFAVINTKKTPEICQPVISKNHKSDLSAHGIPATLDITAVYYSILVYV